MSLLDSTGIGEIADLASLGIGVGELISGNAQQKRANLLLPETTDPQEQDFYDTILNLNKTTRTGAAYNSALKQIKELASEGVGHSLPGAAGQEEEQTAYDKALDAYGGVLANADKKQMQLLGLQDTVLDRMVSRRADIQMLQYSQAQQDARDEKQAGFSNITGALAQAIGGFKGTGTGSNNSNTEKAQAPVTPPDNQDAGGAGPSDGLSSLYNTRQKTTFSLFGDNGLDLYNDSLNT